MMQEKAMVSDVLNTINSSLKTYTDMISQTENQELRSTLQQMRNEAEQSQYELFTIAKNKKYYQPAGQASQNEIDNLKSSLLGSSGMSGGSMTGSSSGMPGSSTSGSSLGMTGSSTSGSSSGTLGSSTSGIGSGMASDTGTNSIGMGSMSNSSSGLGSSGSSSSLNSLGVPVNTNGLGGSLSSGSMGNSTK